MIAIFALVVIALMAAAVMGVSTESARFSGHTSSVLAQRNAAASAADMARVLLSSQNSLIRTTLGVSSSNVVYIVNYTANGLPGEPWVYSNDPGNYDWSYLYTPDPFSASQAACEAALSQDAAGTQGPPGTAPAGCAATNFATPQVIATVAAGGTLDWHLPSSVAWVRLNLATEDVAGQVIDSSSGLAGAPLLYDAVAGRYPQGSALGQGAADPNQVYQIVADGGGSAVREEVTPFVFPFQPPSSVFETGDNPVFSHPDSANWGANGQDSSSPEFLPALGGTSQAAVNNLISQLKRPDNYTGAGGTPSVVNLSAPPAGISALNPNYNQVGSVSPQTGLKGVIAQLAKIADNTCTAPGGTLSCNGPTPTFQTPQVTVVEGDITLPTSGSGIVLATGTITLPKNISWNGLIIDIGAGLISGTNGHPTFNGAIFDANICGNPSDPSENLGINESAVPSRFNAQLPELAGCTTIGSATLNIGNGGGNGGLQFDSQAINTAFNNRSFILLSFQEQSGPPI